MPETGKNSASPMSLRNIRPLLLRLADLQPFMVRGEQIHPGRHRIRLSREAIGKELGSRKLLIAAAFVFLWTFRPSFGTSQLYYQTDVLGFTQSFIGFLAALNSGGGIAGAAIYALISKRFSLPRLLSISIGLGLCGILAYLAYRGATQAILIDTLFGCLDMITTLAILDFAARACPAHMEATFFALFMSVYNAGMKLSRVLGGYIYDELGYTALIMISAAAMAVLWIVLPLLKLPEQQKD